MLGGKAYRELAAPCETRLSSEARTVAGPVLGQGAPAGVAVACGAPPTETASGRCRGGLTGEAPARSAEDDDATVETVRRTTMTPQSSALRPHDGARGVTGRQGRPRVFILWMGRPLGGERRPSAPGPCFARARTATNVPGAGGRQRCRPDPSRGPSREERPGELRGALGEPGSSAGRAGGGIHGPLCIAPHRRQRPVGSRLRTELAELAGFTMLRPPRPGALLRSISTRS
jgi:hypothetical protein